MTSEHSREPVAYIRTMADGTTKQINPLSGTKVWTVPGRGDRPLAHVPPEVKPLTPSDFTTSCAFCSDRYLETPPEKVRSVVPVDPSEPAATSKGQSSSCSTPTVDSSDDGGYLRRTGLTPHEVTVQVAEFRRIPNLFEIMSVDYWQANFGYTFPDAIDARRRAYEAAPGGREHLLRLAKVRLGARADGLDDGALLDAAEDFFASTHDVIVARRHFVDGATTSDQLASSGTLTPTEHREYLDLTIDAIAELYTVNSHVQYVAAFQNWLKPAGASFDHLHKQVVGIDEYGTSTDLDVASARRDPHVFEALLAYAVEHDLVLARTDHAVAIAGFGHRYPSIEIWSTSDTCGPWRMSDDERHAMADLVHAMHAATGADVPCNEEWHHRPPSVTDVDVPWHVVLKWRIANLAGFEGSTKIYLNTISPEGVRERVRPVLHDLQDDGHLAPGVRL